MRQLIKIGLGVLMICLVATGGTQIFARRQATPDYLSALHLTDCAIPCWIGIEPGKTTIEEARQHLTALFQESQVFTLEFPTATSVGTVWVKLRDQKDPSVYIEILIFTTQGIVTATTFSFVSYNRIIFVPGSNYSAFPLDNGITFARLHALFGAPTKMIVPNMTLNRLDTLTLIYGHDDWGMLAHVMDLNPNAPIISMVFFGNAGPLAADSVGATQIQSWRGFLSRQRYYNLMMQSIP